MKGKASKTEPFYKMLKAPEESSLMAGVPKPWAPDWYQSWRWAAGDRAKLHLYLQLLPIAHITAWAPPPVRSVVALDSHRSSNPTVNCACEGSRLHAPYENLMPDDLRWSWGGARAGEQLQIQIIISREVWLHRDHNKSIACRLISKPYQWTSLVAQWLRIHLPTQGTPVQSLVREDPTGHGATKPMRHNYWACALEPTHHNYWAHVPQLLKPVRLEPVLHNKRSHHNEKPAHGNKE